MNSALTKHPISFIPDVILYLSYYYTKTDLPVRLAFFWSINYIADLVTAFLAVGLLKMRGTLGYAGWRWMFLIEGLVTLVVGGMSTFDSDQVDDRLTNPEVASFWLMPQAPAKTKTRLVPRGYFNEREAKIVVNRTLRDDPTKSGMHNRQPLTFRMIFDSIMDYHMWPL